MSKELSVLMLGAAVIIVPFLGIPSSWRTVLLLAIGVALVVIGYMMRSPGTHAKSSPYHPFVENVPSAADTTPLAHAHEHKEGITSLN